jgi:hypothetical protein
MIGGTPPGLGPGPAPEQQRQHNKRMRREELIRTATIILNGSSRSVYTVNGGSITRDLLDVLPLEALAMATALLDHIDELIEERYPEPLAEEQNGG